MLKTACRNSSWFGFYDFDKNVNFGPTEGSFFCFCCCCFFFSAKTLIPHNSKSICRSSMKFGMQLPYGNASGQFFHFFEFRLGTLLSPPMNLDFWGPPNFDQVKMLRSCSNLVCLFLTTFPRWVFYPNFEFRKKNSFPPHELRDFLGSPEF